MFDFLAKGGVLVIPILLCSVMALAIFVERMIRFAKIDIRGKGMAEKIARLLKQGNKKEALEAAMASQSPMGRVLAQAIDVKGQDREAL